MWKNVKALDSGAKIIDLLKTMQTVQATFPSTRWICCLITQKLASLKKHVQR